MALWLVYSLGSLNITKIAQLSYHEQWPVTLSTILETGAFVLLFLVIGLTYVILLPVIKRLMHKSETPKNGANGQAGKGATLSRISPDAKMLIVAWMIGALMLTKNEWIRLCPYQPEHAPEPVLHVFRRCGHRARGLRHVRTAGCYRFQATAGRH